jgi:hypothetical protein
LGFDLGGRATTPEEVDHVVGRATVLFEAAFGTEDPCIVVAQDWPESNRHPWLVNAPPLFTLSQRNALGLTTPQAQRKLLDEEEPETGPYTLTWVEQQARTFHYKLIFEAIANADHARSPAISSRVYLINPDTNVVFYMYDDRGLDLLAPQKSTLLPFYEDFNTWILDYNRARIDRTFSDKT